MAAHRINNILITLQGLTKQFFNIIKLLIPFAEDVSAKLLTSLIQSMDNLKSEVN
jgi:hypothetical protein